MPSALIYCRVSSAAQQDNYSLETQEAACRQFAEANGFTVDGVTLEVWTAAEFWERPKLSAIRERIQRREIDAVICYAIDRLSRDVAHLTIFIDECERAKVAPLFVTESFDDSPEGKLIRSIRGYTAEVERQKIKERVTRGMKARVASGKLPNGSGKLYGYTQDRETTARQIHPTEAAIVRRIWDEAFRQGIGALTIARRLNRENIPSPASQKRKWPEGQTPQWSKSAILEILKNPAYAGLSYAFRYQAERINGKITHRLRKASEWLLLPDSLTPAIISREMFEAMPAKLQSRRASADGARNLTRPVLLRGFVFCVCGRRRSFDPSHGYRCPSRSAVIRHCQSSCTPADALHDTVWNEVASLMSDPARLQALIEAAARNEIGDKSALTEQAARLESAIQQNRKKVEKMLATFADAEGELSEMIESQTRAILETNRALRAELEAVQAKLELTGAQEFQAAKLSELANGLLDDWQDSIERKREIFGILGLRVTTNGRKDWQIDFAVPLTEKENGRPALNLTLFKAKCPEITDGRARSTICQRPSL